MTKAQTQQTLHVRMLGNFALSVDGRVLYSGDADSQMWNLMAYLVLSRNKKLSQQQLLDALWDDSVDDPVAALKNLIYRLRRTLESLGVEDSQKRILCSGGSYSWNRALPSTVDVEKLEAACAEAENVSDAKAAGKLLERIDALYVGDFLPGAVSHIWVTPVSRYYHELYFRRAQSLTALCAAAGDWETVERASAHAGEIDPFEEPSQYYRLQSLYYLHRQSEALQQYSYLADLSYRELGAELSERVRQTFRLVSQADSRGHIEVGQLKNELQESNDQNGAYYCEYEIFKSLYHIRARGMVRDGLTSFLTLLGVLSPEGSRDDKKLQQAAMKYLYRAIREDLRLGDIFARCSATQYVVLLSNLAYEDGMKVIKRISRRFTMLSGARRLRLETTMRPIAPA